MNEEGCKKQTWPFVIYGKDYFKDHIIRTMPITPPWCKDKPTIEIKWAYFEKP